MRDILVSRAYETRLASVQAAWSAIQSVHVDGIPTQAIEPAEPNWWGALNSVTAWVDHVQSTPGDRYAHVLLGSGDKLKAAALTITTEAALVAR